MNKKMPRTPFSTPLSGSARETEIRLKNIFSGPKKRPPVLFLALMCAVCLLCGNLVSCQVAEPEEPDGSARPETIQAGDLSAPEPHASRAVSIDPDHLPQSEEEEWLLQALFQAANEQQEFQIPKARLVNSIQKDGCVLGAAFVEDHLANTLILGVMDRETHELTGPVFRCDQHVGVLSTVVFQNYDGEDCLLYTFNGQMNGQYFGEAGVVRLDGSDLRWEWPVKGDASDGNTEYWNGHYAVMAPGGVDVYSVNPDFEWGQDEPWSMWQLESGETFYTDPSSAVELPMPVYFQSLNWLIEHTNDPGGWRIASLTLNEERCDPEGMVDCFTLQAREEMGAVGTGELTADLFFPYEQDGPRRAYGNLHHGEIHKTYNTLPALLDDGKPDEKEEDDDWDWEEQEAAQIAEYQSVGITMDGKDYYYQGQLVNIFLDQRPNKSIYTLNRNPSGTVNVKILRSDDGTITGAAYLTSAETAELDERFEA